MKLQEHVPLAPYTTFRIGGAARWFAEATNEADVAEAVRFARGQSLPLFVLGGGSNLLVSDAGYPGVVLRVGLTGVEEKLQGAQRLFRVAAGEDWDRLVSRTVAANAAGMECLAGVPGTVGGTPVQNVGAYGQEVAQTIRRVRGFDREVECFREFTAEECGFAYRTSRFNTVDRGRYILTQVEFSLVQDGSPLLDYADLKRYFQETGTSASLQAVSEAVREIRARKGMVLGSGAPDTCSAGSFFKNPVVAAAVYEEIAARFAPAPVPHYPAPDASTGAEQVKLPAAWLLEKAGFHRGYVRGEAGISSRHTLALINRGQARATDILALRDEIQHGVQQQFGVHLEPEPVWVE